MSFEVRATPEFGRRARRLVRKHPTLVAVLENLIQVLGKQPDLGVSLGSNVYKIRLQLGTKGKRGGARVVSYVYWQGERVYLLTIYDKSEDRSVSTAYIKQLIDGLGLDAT
jgi:hypothetical protein